MSIYAHIKRCLELSDKDIASAIADRRLAKALLDQLSKVSKPSDGAPKLLLVFAKIAAAQVDWIDGELRVELVDNGDTTTVDVLTEMGMGMRERVFPSLKMAVPMEEFSRAVERVPHMIAPLSTAGSSDKRLVLSTGDGDDDAEFEQIKTSESMPVAAAEPAYAERRTSSKDKMAAVRSSAPKVKSAQKSARPEAPIPPNPVPKIIAARSGRTLRPAAGPQAATPRIAPIIVPRAPALPRGEEQDSDEPPPPPKRAVVARVPLARIQVPRSAATGSHPSATTGSRPPTARAAASAPKRGSKPPARRASVKPAPQSKGAIRASKAPPRNPSARPPAKAKRGSISEPPDEESIDTGWEEDS